MRRLMAMLAASALLALSGGCGGSRTGEPVHIDSNAGVNTPPPSASSRSTAPTKQAPQPAVAPTALNTATIQALSSEATEVERLNDQAVAHGGSLGGKDADICNFNAKTYNDTVSELHLTAAQLEAVEIIGPKGPTSLPQPPLICDASR